MEQDQYLAAQDFLRNAGVNPQHLKKEGLDTVKLASSLKYIKKLHPFVEGKCTMKELHPRECFPETLYGALKIYRTFFDNCDSHDIKRNRKMISNLAKVPLAGGTMLGGRLTIVPEQSIKNVNNKKSNLVPRKYKRFEMEIYVDKKIKDVNTVWAIAYIALLLFTAISVGLTWFFCIK